MTTQTVFLLAVLLSNNLFANKELWDNVKNKNWEPIGVFLGESQNAQGDLEWCEEGVYSIRDVLLDVRKEIKEQHEQLYNILFSEQGLMPWESNGESPAVDKFIDTAKIQLLFEQTLPEGSPIEKILRGYRKLLANSFCGDELQELSEIYRYPDFQLYLERFFFQKPEDAFREIFVGYQFPLPEKGDRFDVIELLTSTLGYSREDESVLKLVEDRFKDFSNERIMDLAEKVDSVAYHRELGKRAAVLKRFGYDKK